MFFEIEIKKMIIPKCCSRLVDAVRLENTGGSLLPGLRSNGVS